MENLHGIAVDYVPQTDTKPHRIKIKSLRFNKSIFVSYDNSCSYVYQVEKYLESQGFSIVGLIENGNGFILVVNEFKNIK